MTDALLIAACFGLPLAFVVFGFWFSRGSF